MSYFRNVNLKWAVCNARGLSYTVPACPWHESSGNQRAMLEIPEVFDAVLY